MKLFVNKAVKFYEKLWRGGEKNRINIHIYIKLLQFFFI